ncbi:MAG: bifunctional (p)ppGpp synthetase/guanosine-3',5'-bis(diphosphate) 3'-pyrophosphohydrolase [Leptospiraceae bacterium]|nr:bifunctional (p)ppGpp synthetase/guanosine-3',5'-bis(diphosphate) 3'-pyrophosphohydrolase [Leptospiraceae bacterium]
MKPEFVNIYHDTLIYSMEAHKSQLFKISKLPFFDHFYEVGKILMEVNAEIEVIQAGILHDVPEDTEITIENISNRFGNKIANTVKEVTSKKNKSSDYMNRKLEKILSLQTCSIEALQVSIADRIDNLNRLHKDFILAGDSIWISFGNGKKEEIKQLHETAIGIFADRKYESEVVYKLFQKVAEEYKRLVRGAIFD